MKLIFTFIALAVATATQAQNNDDVYYSPSQNPPVSQSQSAVEETPAPVIYEEPPYSTPDGQQFDGIGSADAGNSQIEIQGKKGISTESYDDGYGNTYITNNYNGDVYNYDNENDYNYSAHLRRYYNPAPGFGYYDPFYDPFWGYNSWYYTPGFSLSIGFGAGWGYPWYGGYYGWGYPSFGWGYPYYGWGYPGYGGYYPYYGWGNSYYHGYNHGYYHGYHDGYYGNGHSSYNTYYGPRRSATGSGSSDVHSGNVSGPRVIKSEMPSGNTSTKTGINQYNRNVTPAPSNSLGQPSGTNSINKNKPSTSPSRNISGYKNNKQANTNIKNPSTQPSGIKTPAGNKGNIRMEQQKNINNNTAPANPRNKSNNQIQRNKNIQSQPQPIERNAEPRRSAPGGSKNYSAPKGNMPSMQHAPAGGLGSPSMKGGSNSQPRNVR